MSFDVLGELNWLAVIVATVVFYVIGGVWFAGPVLGKVWQRSIGYDPEGKRIPLLYYIGPFVTALVSVVATAMLAEATGSNTFAEGIVLGLVVGVGFAAAALYVTGGLEPTKPQPLPWFLVTAGYQVLGLLVAAVILSVWR